MTEEQKTEVVPGEQGKPQQPTVEELQSQLATLKETSKRMEDNWKNEQRVSSKHATDKRRLEERLADILKRN